MPVVAIGNRSSVITQGQTPEVLNELFKMKKTGQIKVEVVAVDMYAVRGFKTLMFSDTPLDKGAFPGQQVNEIMRLGIPPIHISLDGGKITGITGGDKWVDSGNRQALANLLKGIEGSEETLRKANFKEQPRKFERM